jgi:hypothetical protein
MFVFGMGESKTPLSLVNSCESFAYLDKMLQIGGEKKEVSEEKTEAEVVAPKRNKKKVVSSITPLSTIINELKTIIRDTAEDDGWSYWGNVAQLFQRKFPGFHPRNYGENIKALAFFKKQKDFEFEQRKSSIFVKTV